MFCIWSVPEEGGNVSVEPVVVARGNYPTPKGDKGKALADPAVIGRKTAAAVEVRADFGVLGYGAAKGFFFGKGNML